MSTVAEIFLLIRVGQIQKPERANAKDSDRHSVACFLTQSLWRRLEDAAGSFWQLLEVRRNIRWAPYGFAKPPRPSVDEQYRRRPYVFTAALGGLEGYKYVLRISVWSTSFHSTNALYPLSVTKSLPSFKDSSSLHQHLSQHVFLPSLRTWRFHSTVPPPGRFRQQSGHSR